MLANRFKSFSRLTIGTLCILSILFSGLRYIKWCKKHKAAPTNKSCAIWTKLKTPFPVVEQKPLTLVITSYNNETVCKRNLQSIFDQTYENYRVIYIDDSSKDATYEKVKAYVRERGKEDKITLIRNQTRRLKLANVYNAYHSCEDHEIIVSIDGDDWLAHEQVLEKINEAYQNPDVWMTYGSAITHPDYNRRSGEPIKDSILLSGSVRQTNKFVLSMLRTFYAGLFKQIHLKDFFHHGSFFPTADDVAYMTPMIEMAPTHTLFIPDILYIINDNNPIRNEFVVGALERNVRLLIQTQKKAYSPLPESFDPRHATPTPKTTDLQLFVFSENNPLLLQASLESYQENLIPCPAITVIYKASEEYLLAYKELSSLFPSISFSSSYPLQLLENKQPYVLVATDNFCLTERVSLAECLTEMEATGAVNFLLGCESKNCFSVKVNEQALACSVSELLKAPDLLSGGFFGIFRKDDLLKTLKNKTLKEDNLLEAHLALTNHKDEITLFPAQKKAYLLDPHNKFSGLAKSFLLKKFQDGYSVALTSLKDHIDQGLKEEDFVQTTLLPAPLP